MAAQKGKDLLLKVDGDGTGTFTTVAGLRSRAHRFQRGDRRHHASGVGRAQWRELLEGAGVQNARITGSGIFKDAASDEMLRASFSTARSATGSRHSGFRHGRGPVPDHLARADRPPRQRGRLRDRARVAGELAFTAACESARNDSSRSRLGCARRHGEPRQCSRIDTDMANRHRGEIEARLDGRPYRLCLTLGALAELEAAFGDEDMLALATRFENGRLRRATACALSARACAAAATISPTRRSAACRHGRRRGGLRRDRRARCCSDVRQREAAAAQRPHAAGEARRPAPFPGTT